MSDWTAADRGVSSAEYGSRFRHRHFQGKAATANRGLSALGGHR